MPAVITAECIRASVVNASSVTRSVNFGTAPDRGVFIIMGREGALISPTACTVDGVAATQVDSWTSGSGVPYAVYTAVGVGTGARDVVMTWSGVSGNALYLIVPMSDVASLSHKTRHTGATPPGPTSTFASAAGRLAVQAIVFESSASAASAGAGATLVWSDGSNGAHVVTEPCATSTTIETTVSGSTVMRGATLEATGAASSILGGNVTLDAAAPAGTFGSSSSDLGGNVTADPAVAAGTLGAQPGSIVTVPFRNKFTGALIASFTVPKVSVLRVSDMASVLSLTNVATAADGRMTITNAALSAGVQYLVVTCNSDGSAYGAEAYTAA